jgi:NADPH-dependent 2,4-dienoyl-CoA reductase/sulfur reductase-like enzyme
LRSEIDVAVVLADAFPNYSICGLPFYVSGETVDWRQLAHRTEFPGIELLCNRVAESIDAARKVVIIRTPEGITQTLAYDKLIIATGAKPLIPDVPGIEHVHPLHTMADSFKVHEKVTSGKVRRAAVVGVGYIGVEMADALTHRGIEVELIGRSRSVLPTVDFEIGEVIREQLEIRNVSVRTGVEIKRIRRADDGLVLEGPDAFVSTVDLIVWATGVSPASDFARSAGIDTGIRGAYRATRQMETNLPDVYAAGDCVETWHRVLQKYVWLPLGTTAHKQGRIAGENAVGGHAEFAGALGTQVVKVFDLAIARTGLLDHEAKAAGFSPLTSCAEPYDHKAYYPSAEKLHIRVTGDAQNSRFLGAQIAGNWKAEVAKRIDVFATALFHQMKVDELNALDLSYTPPLGSPWDAVQLAAQAWTARQLSNGKQEIGNR